MMSDNVLIPVFMASVLALAGAAFGVVSWQDNYARDHRVERQPRAEQKLRENGFSILGYQHSEYTSLWDDQGAQDLVDCYTLAQVPDAGARYTGCVAIPRDPRGTRITSITPLSIPKAD